MIELTTPALLFSTVSLTMLAYTNRFLALARLIRELHDQYNRQPEVSVFRQIYILKHRLDLIKQMQMLCILALTFSMLSMLLLLTEYSISAGWCLGISLILLIISLGISVLEISLSTYAINVSLQGIEHKLRRSKNSNLIYRKVGALKSMVFKGK